MAIKLVPETRSESPVESTKIESHPDLEIFILTSSIDNLRHLIFCNCCFIMYFKVKQICVITNGICVESLLVSSEKSGIWHSHKNLT